MHSFISVLTKAWKIKGTMTPIQNTIRRMSFWVKAGYLAKWLMDCSPPERTGSTWNLSKLLRMEKCIAKKGFFFSIFPPLNSVELYLNVDFPFRFASYIKWVTPHRERGNWTPLAGISIPPSWQLVCMTFFVTTFGDHKNCG